MTRHGLLLTAVATVTIPSLLAVMAVLGHEHVATEAGATAVALDGAPLSSPSPQASAVAPVPVRPGVARRQAASGTVGTASGMHLLGLAANAGLATSYQGIELVSQSSMDGSVKMVSQVWHKGGGSTLVETSSGTKPTTAPATAARSGRTAVASSDPASGSPEGVFGVTKGLVAQLGKHYSAVYWGSGSVVGRPTSVVELYRVNGSLAARYWLDSRTLVPLRRELFGTSHNVISEDSFVRIRFGAFTPPRNASAAAAPSRSPGQTQPSDWVTASSPAKFLTRLTGQGWQVPASSPGGLPLYAAASTKTSSGEIVALEYTDGLYVVSLFMQRGTLT
ncbi:MAG: sigma-E factor regulatory protein RseB domain-containing protein, partial [Trebonia sp.]